MLSAENIDTLKLILLLNLETLFKCMMENYVNKKLFLYTIFCANSSNFSCLFISNVVFVCFVNCTVQLPIIFVACKLIFL